MININPSKFGLKIGDKFITKDGSEEEYVLCDVENSFYFCRKNFMVELGEFWQLYFDKINF